MIGEIVPRDCTRCFRPCSSESKLHKMSELAPVSNRQSETVRLTLSQLPGETPLSSLLRMVCQHASSVIPVERVSVWFFENNGRTLRCVNLFETSKNRHSSGLKLPADRIPSYTASLLRRRTLPIERVSDLPWSRELHEDYCKPLGIISILDSGIFHSGRLVGVVCHEQINTSYDWTTEDRDFSASLADFISSRMPPTWTEDNLKNLGAAAPRTPQGIKMEAQQIARRIACDAESLLQLLQTSDRTLPGHAQLFVFGEDIRQAADECIRVTQS
jgi:hypothetical protein